MRYVTARSEWFLNLVSRPHHVFPSRYMHADLASSIKTVVLPNGKVIKTRRRARKSAAGFDTTKLFIGAEGTLGEPPEFP